MFERDMSYWFWLCHSVTEEQEDCNRNVNPGELFTAMIDRFHPAAPSSNKVIQSFQSLAYEMENYNRKIDDMVQRELQKTSFTAADVDWLTKVKEFKVIAEEIYKYQLRLREKSTEKEFNELKQLSVGIFAKLNRLNSLICTLKLETEPFRLCIRSLKEESEEVVKHFQNEIINEHAKYFREYPLGEPIHLAYRVYCLEFLTRIVKYYFTFVGSPQLLELTIEFPRRMYKDLLDWHGDYDSAVDYYWRQELNEIMSLERTDDPYDDTTRRW